MDFVNSRRIMSNEKTFAAADGLSVLSANFFHLIKAENSNNGKPTCFTSKSAKPPHKNKRTLALHGGIFIFLTAEQGAYLPQSSWYKPKYSFADCFQLKSAFIALVTRAFQFFLSQ